MVDTFYDDNVVAHSDRMSDVASSEHPVSSSGRPSCSSCSGSSRPSSGGGSTFRQKCSSCKMKHHKKQPCRQNAVDAELCSGPIEHGARTVVSLRVPPGASTSSIPTSTSCVGHFEVGRSSSLYPSTASESSGGHSSRHRKCSQCANSGPHNLPRKRHSDHSKRSGHSTSSSSRGGSGKDPGANLLSNIKALFNNWLEKSRASKSGSCGGGAKAHHASSSAMAAVALAAAAAAAKETKESSTSSSPTAMMSSGVTLVNGDSSVSGPSLPSPFHQQQVQQPANGPVFHHPFASSGALAGPGCGYHGYPGHHSHHHHHHHSRHQHAHHVAAAHQQCHPGQAPGQGCYLNVACPQFPQECTADDLVCMHNVISINSSFDSDCLLHCYNNVCSSLCSTGCHSTGSIPTTLSTTTNSEPPSNAGVEAMDLNLLTASTANGRYWETHVDYDVLLRRNPRLMGKQFLSAQNPLVPSRSCPTKSKSLQSQGSKQKDLLCSTWPPSGKRIFLPETEEEFQVDHDDVLIERIGPSQFAKEHLYEFNIPFSDIKFTECLKTGSCRKIHRGQWHGEVMIHTYDHLNHKEISKFWEEVQKLSMVRHENIALFMGASMDPPNFAVVTETRKGCSLYEKLHVSREKTSQSFKLSVLRQLAQALGYLHAKGIVVKRLNSKHIFLEPKVKLCLLDFSALEDEYGKDNSLALHNSVIYYMAPEVLTASHTENSNRFCDENIFTNASDVFALGTIMFEVQTSRYPFYKLGPQRLMECICEGKREDTKELRCSDTVKNLIRDCWSHDPLYRPELSDINKDLQHRNAAHKRHSSSEPENLHRLTFGKLSYL